MEKIKKLKQNFKVHNIDGYLIPKNDEFFGEYVLEQNDRLKFISNFSGSYGFCLILKKKNYLFVDGRYTLQAKKQCGKFFNIITMPSKMPNKIFKNQKYKIGFDPKLFTQKTLKLFFKGINFNLTPISFNLVDNLFLSDFQELMELIRNDDCGANIPSEQPLVAAINATISAFEA